MTVRKKYFCYVPNSIATVGLLLRRTLLRSVILFAILQQFVLYQTV